jgi:hypothetical protein
MHPNQEDAMKDEFIATVSHELRTPVTLRPVFDGYPAELTPLGVCKTHRRVSGLRLSQEDLVHAFRHCQPLNRSRER